VLSHSQEIEKSLSEHKIKRVPGSPPPSCSSSSCGGKNLGTRLVSTDLASHLESLDLEKNPGLPKISGAHAVRLVCSYARTELAQRVMS